MRSYLHSANYHTLKHRLSNGNAGDLRQRAAIKSREFAAWLVTPQQAPPARARLGLTDPFLRRACWWSALCLALSFVVLPSALAAKPQAGDAEGHLGQALALSQKMQKAEKARAKEEAAQSDLQRRIAVSLVPHKSPLSSLAQMQRRDALRRARLAARPARHIPSTPPTLLDQVGLLAHPVAAPQVSAWQAELHTGRTPTERAALLHLWLGEWLLAHDEQPEAAQWQWRQTRHETTRQDPLNGLATYDTAMARYYQGAYEDAADSFHALLTPRTWLPGYDMRRCVLWWRHAEACAGYHAQHALLGIPEPPQLDPECGAAALAAGLRALGRPYDKKTMLAACRVTGEGSSLADIVAAGPKLGVDVRAVAATDEGLRNLPKPVVAYVEHDHFIAVTRADAKGVTYLCSDCGTWPGGEVDLTWGQWHTMNPGVYAAITKPGSLMDRALVARLTGKAPASLVASLPGRTGLLGKTVRPYLPALPALRGVTVLEGTNTYQECDSKFWSLLCASCTICCLEAIINSFPGGATPGDPINLATGEEQYEPPTDLTVYNPYGPAVSWGRVYNSLDSPAEGSGSGSYSLSVGYGDGWSDTYNISVVNEAVYFPNASRVTFTQSSYSPTAGNPILCPAQPGAPLVIYYNYSSSGDYYSVTFKDRTQWVMNSSGQLSQIVDRNGNAITFHYNNSLLSSITNTNNTTLLTILRDPNGNIIAISDCYGRSVYYHEGYYGNYAANLYELDWVSQIVPSCASAPLARYQYGYEDVPDPEGNPVQFLHTIIVPSATGTGTATATINYNSSEQVSSVVDANGNTTSISPVGSTPSNSTKVTVTDAHGNTIYSYTGTYDNNMSAVSETDGAGHLLYQKVFSDPNDPYRPSMELDGNALQSHANPVLPQGSTMAINPTGSQAPATGTWDILAPNGTAVTNSTVNGSGWSVSAPTNTQQNPPITVTAPAGAAIGNGYTVRISGYFTVSAQFDIISNSAGYGTARATWDQYGNETSETSPRGTTTTNTYSYTNFALGELTQTQEGSKTPTQYVYVEPSGLVSAVYTPTPGTSGTGATVKTSYTYDQYGDVLSVTTPGNNAASTITVNYGYGSSPAIGQPLTVSDALGHTTTYTYDAQANVTSVTDASGNETIYGNAGGTNGYNIANQPLQVLEPATGESGSGHVDVVATYLYPGGPAVSAQTYDESGTLIRQVNTTYGLEGETLAVTGSTEPRAYTYDGLYRMKTLMDGGGHTTTYTYNQAGYLATASFPGAGGATSGSDTVNCTYDYDGDVLTRVDGRGITTDYVYNDPESRLTDIEYPASSSQNVHFNYDQYGRRGNTTAGAAGMTDATGSTAYAYDDDNEAVSVATTFTGLSAQTISYAYYSDGQRQNMSTPAGTFSYAYDQVGRMTGLTNPFSEATSWTYQSNNWLQTQAQANGVTTTYGYDARGLTTALASKTSGGVTLSQFSSMVYDGAGDRTTATASIPSAPSAYSGQTTYAYDARSELTQEQSARAGGYTDSQVYDGTTGSTTTGPGNSTVLRGVTHSFNADNQDTANTYDGNGNPTDYKGAGLTFDPENRMTAYGSAMTAGYNADGLRAVKGGTAGTIYFLYDGEQTVCELNSSSTVTAVNTFGAAGLVSRHTSAGSEFYTFDASGNVCERLTASATMASADITDGFGARTTTDTTNDPFGFSGQWGGYTDAETGLVLLTHREYDPATGRWLTRDPIGYDGGIDLYGFCQNDPVDGIDPSGMYRVFPNGLPPILQPGGILGGGQGPVKAPPASPTIPYPSPLPRPPTDPPGGIGGPPYKPVPQPPSPVTSPGNAPTIHGPKFPVGTPPPPKPPKGPWSPVQPGSGGATGTIGTVPGGYGIGGTWPGNGGTWGFECWKNNKGWGGGIGFSNGGPGVIPPPSGPDGPGGW